MTKIPKTTRDNDIVFFNIQTVLLFLLLMAVGLPAVGQRLTGCIIDQQTGDSIAMATVRYKEGGVNVVSDLNGRFSIDRFEGGQLAVSAIGYQPKVVTAERGKQITIRLKPETQQLQGVTVRHRRGRYSRKNNPAVEMMRKVVAAKKQNDLRQRDYVQFNKYQKMTLAFSEITPALLDSPKFKKRPWIAEQIERCPYNDKLVLPVSVEENVTQYLYRKSPRTEKRIIKGERKTGINDIIETGDILNTVMKDVFTDVNLYDDQIRLLQYPFTSPIGKDAIDFYRFYIEDTLMVGRDLCFHLHFMPNNQQDFGFRGDLYVLADSSWQVRRCEMTIPKKSDVNFVENMKITQEYTRLEDGTWVQTADDMFTELKFAKFLNKLAVIRTNRLTDFSFEELPRQLFRGKRQEVKDVNAMMQNDDFWNRYRQVQLTRSESTMDNFIHSLENIKGFKYIVFGVRALVENFVETGSKKTPSKVDIGPVNTILTRNFIDGWRTRVSAQTTANLDSSFFARGYVARGWGSRKWYYKGDLIWSFNKKEYLPREFPQRTLTFSSTYDVTAPSDKFLHTDKDNFLTAFKWTKVDQMMFYNRQQISFEREEYWGFRTTVSIKTEENEAAGALYFIPLSESSDRSLWTNWSHPAHTDQGAGLVRSRKFRTTEIRGELRFAPGETFINTKQRRLPINLDAPVFTASHTMGIKNLLGSDYSYNLTEASVYKRFWLKSWGKLDVQVKGGIQWEKVPYPLLCMPETNLSYIIQDYTFQAINDMEFLNDRYVQAMVNWDMNGKLFNRIPLLKKLKWREWISAKMLWGELSDKNNPTLEQNAGSPLLMYFPEHSYIMDAHKPYWELSIGIHNIFKIIQLEYVRRLNYNHLPTAHKHGFRLTVRMTF